MVRAASLPTAWDDGVMPERSRKRRPADLNSLAASIVADSTDEDKDEPADDGKDPAAVALGRKGGLKGGRARGPGICFGSPILQ